MVTALWQRAHRKSLGGGWVVDMGVHAHACNQLLDRHARFVKYYACNVALQQGLGARQWVDRLSYCHCRACFSHRQGDL